MTTSSRVPMEKLAVSYGLFMGLALIVYFVIMHLAGLSHIVELRYVNVLIIAVGVVMALKHLKRSKQGMINYLEGLGLGFAAAAVAGIIFTVFFLIFINFIAPNFLETIMAYKYFPDGTGTMAMLVIALVVMLECLVTGFFTAFISMQGMKRPDHMVGGQQQNYK